MIKIEAKLKLKKHIWNNYADGSFDYSSCHICYSFGEKNKDLEMFISILTKESSEEISPVLIEIIDFLYLACGTMPYIVYYKENDAEKDLSRFSCRFFPSKQFFHNEHLIDINNSTLNETTLESIKNTIRNKPFEIFWAFTALTSQAYEKIYAEHKITLLLQCFEGYILNKDAKYQLRKLSFKERITEIINVLFEYEEKYNTEILKTLTITKDDYLKVLTDTRHQFSHYTSKNNSLSEGKDYIINFVLLHYIFRIYLLREVNVIPKEKNIEEFLKSVYDLINSLKDNKFKEYKSVAYSISLIFQHFN